MKWGIIQEKLKNPLGTFKLRSNTVHVQICNMFTLNMQHGICSNHVGIQNFLKNYKKLGKVLFYECYHWVHFNCSLFRFILERYCDFTRSFISHDTRLNFVEIEHFVRKLHEIWYKKLTGHVGSFQKIFKLISYHKNSKLDRSLFWTENLQYITRSF